ncbi:MAG: metallophosphoesterase [Candidatus Nanoarchaeia archaeon]
MKYEFIDKCLFFPDEKILVVADLHFGYEEALNKAGVMLPKTQYKEIIKELKKIIESTGKLNEIIVLGDLKHEFSGISKQEWKETLDFLDFIKGISKKIVLIKGNHDNMLLPIVKKRNLKLRDYYIKKDFCFLHGDKLYKECLDKKIKYLVIGHRHPAIVIADKYKKERFKCFLIGKWKRKEVMILPSFFPFINGSDVVSEENNELFVNSKDLKCFEVFVVGDKVYRFGELKDFCNF